MKILELKQILQTVKRWVSSHICISCRKPVPLTPGDGATQIFALDLDIENDDISDELLSRINNEAWKELLKDNFVVKRFDFEIESNKKENEENTVQLRVKMKCDKCYKRSNRPIPKGGLN